MPNYYDLTAELSENMMIFPGDPDFKVENIASLATGSNYNLCHLHFGNHIGTHIDFPAHVIKGGKTSSDFEIDYLVGTGQIIEVPDWYISITKDFISNLHIWDNDIVFFKTSNSKLTKNGSFNSKYVFFESEAAVEMLNKKVKIVGIDYMSVDKYEMEMLPIHHLFLSKDVLIIEGLALNNIPAGRYEIYIMPINITNMDGLPVRVIARK